MDADELFHDGTDPGGAERPIGEGGGQRSHPSDEVSLDQQAVTPRGTFFGNALFLPRCHESGEVYFILVRWGIRTVIEAELAVIAFLLYLFEIFGFELVDVIVIVIDPINERIERRTEIKAPSTSIADIKHS